jgi:hypothetical protein
MLLIILNFDSLNEILICKPTSFSTRTLKELSKLMETVWLTQAQMSALFGKDKRTISEHIGNVFKEGELKENVVVRNFRTTTPHGAIEEKTIKGCNSLKSECYLK